MMGPVTASYGLRYVGPVRNDASLLVDGEHLRADDYIQHDLTLMYDWDDQKARFTLGIENVADTMPPFLAGNYATGFDNLTFNSRGRFFFVRLQKGFSALDGTAGPGTATLVAAPGRCGRTDGARR